MAWYWAIIGVCPEKAAPVGMGKEFSFDINDLCDFRKVTPQILMIFQKYSMCDFYFFGGSKNHFLTGTHGMSTLSIIRQDQGISSKIQSKRGACGDQNRTGSATSNLVPHCFFWI
jgi:hypothetical protein